MSPRSYLGPHLRAPECSPNFRYEIIPLHSYCVLVSMVNILHLLFSLCYQIKQMMEAATKQIEERKKQLTFTSSVTSASVMKLTQYLQSLIIYHHFQAVYLSNNQTFTFLIGGCLSHTIVTNWHGSRRCIVYSAFQGRQLHERRD